MGQKHTHENKYREITEKKIDLCHYSLNYICESSSNLGLSPVLMWHIKRLYNIDRLLAKAFMKALTKRALADISDVVIKAPNVIMCHGDNFLDDNYYKSLEKFMDVDKCTAEDILFDIVVVSYYSLKCKKRSPDARDEFIKCMECVETHVWELRKIIRFLPDGKIFTDYLVGNKLFGGKIDFLCEHTLIIISTDNRENISRDNLMVLTYVTLSSVTKVYVVNLGLNSVRHLDASDWTKIHKKEFINTLKP